MGLHALVAVSRAVVSFHSGCSIADSDSDNSLLFFSQVGFGVLQNWPALAKVLHAFGCGQVSKHGA